MDFVARLRRNKSWLLSHGASNGMVHVMFVFVCLPSTVRLLVFQARGMTPGRVVLPLCPLPLNCEVVCRAPVGPDLLRYRARPGKGARQVTWSGPSSNNRGTRSRSKKWFPEPRALNILKYSKLTQANTRHVNPCHINISCTTVTIIFPKVPACDSSCCYSQPREKPLPLVLQLPSWKCNLGSSASHGDTLSFQHLPILDFRRSSWWYSILFYSSITITSCEQSIYSM